jgi:hypothetical protein
MTRATFTIAVVFLCSTAVGEQPTVIFLSPCECQGFHSKNRWVQKTDLTPVPSDMGAPLTLSRARARGAVQPIGFIAIG